MHGDGDFAGAAAGADPLLGGLGTMAAFFRSRQGIDMDFFSWTGVQSWRWLLWIKATRSGMAAS